MFSSSGFFGRFLVCSLLLSGVAGTALFVPAAQAGFQWTAPTGPVNGSVAGSNAKAPNAPALEAVPVPPVSAQALLEPSADVIETTPDGPASAAPIYGPGMTDDPITWNAPHSAAKANPRAPMNVVPMAQNTAQNMAQNPAANSMMAAPVMAQPIIGQPMIAAPAMPAAPMATSAPVGGAQVVEGFGSALPLVMAIRQIVPSTYGFVFDEGIDLSTPVSWQGGQGWDAVLRQTLAPLGLQATVQGQVIAITRGGNGGQPVASMQPATAQPAIVQPASQPLSGPIMMSDTVSSTAQMPMTAMPVSMVAGTNPTVADDGMAGADMGAYSPVSSQPRGITRNTLDSNNTWTAPRNSTLRGILEDWSSRVGVELYWSSEFDYPIQSPVSIQGTFEEAVQTLLKGLSESRPRPLARLHPNLPDGPAVLVVETRQSAL